MTVASTQIKRLRTYSDDVASIRGVKSVSVPTTPAIKTPTERLPLTKSAPAITFMPPTGVKTFPIKKPEPLAFKSENTPPLPPVAPQSTTVIFPKTSALDKVVSKKIPSVVKSTTSAKPPPSDLQKEISILNKNQPDSILTTPTNQLNVDEGRDSGSIVTDRKKDNFNVFTASWSALGTWLDEKFRILDQDKSTKGATVRPIESRREVITKAASQGTIAPRGDKTTVTPVRPATPTNPETSSSPVITIKKAEAVPPTSWSHFKGIEKTETIAATETSKITPSIMPAIPTVAKNDDSLTTVVKPDATEAVVIEPTSATSTTPKPEASTVTAAVTPIKATFLVNREQIPASNSTPVYKKPEETSIPEVTASEIVKVPTYAPDTIVGQGAKLEKEVEIEPPTLTSKTPQKTVRFATPKITPFPIIRVSIIAVTSIIFGVSLALWLFGGNTEPNQPIAGSDIESVALVSPDQKTDVLVTNNRDSFLDSINNADVSSGSLVTLLQPKMNLNGASTVPPTATVLEILSPRWPGSFTRAVEEINFGKLNGQSFLVLKVTSFEAGFSGLLASESTLISDFEPLFGTPVTGTFDLSARTVGNIVDPYFVDSNVKNHDVRILRDELQKERLVYGFINRDTIVIAPDSATFEAVADKIK